MYKYLVITASALVFGLGVTSTLAADLIEEPIYVEPVAYGGLYLRGAIGMSNQQLHGGLDNRLYDSVDSLVFLDHGRFSSAPIYNFGIGYEFNDSFRVDGIVEYRGKADFKALDRITFYDGPDLVVGSNDYSAKKSEWLVMANAYYDIFDWNGIKPYVGAGAGMSRNTISNFQDEGLFEHPINGQYSSLAYGSEHSEWNFAWALHAGLGIDVTDRLTLDLGYSFLHLGDAQSGDLVAYDGTNNVKNPMKFDDITSHDLKFGIRYRFF